MNAAGKSAKNLQKRFSRVASIPLTDASNIRREKKFWFKSQVESVKTCLEDRVRRTGGPLVRWTAAGVRSCTDERFSYVRRKL